MADTLKLKGSRMIVEEAPDPSTIIWENLKYKRVDRIKRRMVTTVVTLILLAISLVVNIISRTIDQNAADSGGKTLCPDNFDGLTQEQQQLMVDGNSELLHCYCDTLSFEEQKQDQSCRQYYKNALAAALFSYFAAFVVLLTNSSIDYYLIASAEHEKHHSVDSMERSVFIRMFLLKLVNTGGVAT
jgi:hypothetical protein